MKRNLLGLVMGGILGLGSLPMTHAEDCGCEATCGVEVGCGAEAACGCEDWEASSCAEPMTCDGGCSRKRPNPIYRSLDAVAGGIEKLFGLDKCRQSRSCDCCVDCNGSGGMVILNEPMAPMSPIVHDHHLHDHHHGFQSNAPHDSAPLPPQGTPHVSQPTSPAPAARNSWGNPRMSQPRLVPSPPSNQNLGNSGALVDPPTVNSDPSPLNEPAMPIPTPDPETNFREDPMMDPFTDDEVHVRRYLPVRPSSYESESSHSSRRRVAGRKDVPHRKLSTSHRTSSRRSSSAR